MLLTYFTLTLNDNTLRFLLFISITFYLFMALMIQIAFFFLSRFNLCNTVNLLFVISNKNEK